MSLQKIREAVQAAEGNARQMGEVVLMIAQADEHAAEVIAADLDNPAMSLQKCLMRFMRTQRRTRRAASGVACAIALTRRIRLFVLLQIFIKSN